MNPVWTMTDANLFCGAGPSDNENSNHLTLTELKLPSLEVAYADHRAGGAPVAIEIDTGVNKLECTFTLLGLTPQVMLLVGSWSSANTMFTAYGVIRDQVSGETAQAAAVIQGQLGLANPNNWTRGTPMHSIYAIRGIIHYELNIAGEQIYLWDFATNTRVIGQIDQNAPINAALNTGSVTAVQPMLRNTTGFNDGV